MEPLAEIERQIAGFGARFDHAVLQKTRSLFRDPVTAQPWIQRTAIQDIPYGDHERHRLDVFPPDNGASPVVLFVHGGGFIGGDKGNDPPFYGNVGRYFAQAGFCAITMNYRLAPADSWPAGAEDVAAALSWVVTNAEAYGGDGSRIMLLGQSAGASHCASYLFDSRIQTSYRPRTKAAALMSGYYLAQGMLSGGPLEYFGGDPAQWADRSPANLVSSPHVPLLLSIAEFDPPDVAQQTYALASALNQVDRRPPRFTWLEGHNHVSTVHGLGLGDDRVGHMLRNFFENACTDREAKT